MKQLAASSVLDDLSRAYPALTDPQKRVADYILKHPREVRDASVAALCRATDASEPVLFAVCRAAGRKGYRQFKLDLAGELAVLRERRRAAGRADGEGAPDIELDGDESPRTLARKVGAAYLESVEAAVAGLDGEVFGRAVEIFRGARRAAVFGMGTSGHVAQLAQFALIRAGLAVTCSTDSYVQLAHAAALGEGDAALAFSYMGEQPETVESLGLARARGAATVAVTCQPDSPLGRAADLVLELPPRRHLASYVSVGARIAAAELYVVDALAAAVALGDRSDFDLRSEAVREVVERRKARRPAGRRGKSKNGKRRAGR
jgi:DNA-binding MurR/RpiR family transcriptional regulator